MANYLTLSELNGIIQQVLNDAVGMQSFWVVADITENTYRESNGYPLPKVSSLWGTKKALPISIRGK